MGILFMFIAMAVSFILLYERKKKWNTDQLRWRITVSLLFVGILGFALKIGDNSGYNFIFLCIPFFYNCFDRLFKSISIKKLGRDFCLYLRYSKEIDDRLFADNPHVKLLDKVFSFLLLVINFGLIFLAVFAYRYTYH